MARRAPRGRTVRTAPEATIQHGACTRWSDANRETAVVRTQTDSPMRRVCFAARFTLAYTCDCATSPTGKSWSILKAARSRATLQGIRAGQQRARAAPTALRSQPCERRAMWGAVKTIPAVPGADATRSPVAARPRSWPAGSWFARGSPPHSWVVGSAALTP